MKDKVYYYSAPSDNELATYSGTFDVTRALYRDEALTEKIGTIHIRAVSLKDNANESNNDVCVKTKKHSFVYNYVRNFNSPIQTNTTYFNQSDFLVKVNREILSNGTTRRLTFSFN